MPFTFKKIDLEGLVLVEPRVFGDSRGYFMETYKHSEFAAFGIREQFVQDNYSRSSKHILRGLHYQTDPHAQSKLVRCVKGRIFDVAVDIRKSSPTFGKWAGIELSDENNLILYIPRGFAHGFLALSDVTEVAYKSTGEYSPAHDTGIIWNDPDINIAWPVKNPVVSEKDNHLPSFKKAEVFG